MKEPTTAEEVKVLHELLRSDAERYLQMGSSVVAVCADMGLLKGAAQTVQQHFKRKTTDPQPQPQ